MLYIYYNKLLNNKCQWFSYVEKHFGKGNGNGEKVLNPKTVIEVESVDMQFDSIIMDKARVEIIPKISAFHIADSQLIHEAAIWKITND